MVRASASERSARARLPPFGSPDTRHKVDDLSMWRSPECVSRARPATGQPASPGSNSAPPLLRTLHAASSVASPPPDFLAGLEQQHRHLPHVKVHVMPLRAGDGSSGPRQTTRARLLSRDTGVLRESHARGRARKAGGLRAAPLLAACSSVERAPARGSCTPRSCAPQSNATPRCTARRRQWGERESAAWWAERGARGGASWSCQLGAPFGTVARRRAEIRGCCTPTSHGICLTFLTNAFRTA